LFFVLNLFTQLLRVAQTFSVSTHLEHSFGADLATFCEALHTRTHFKHHWQLIDHGMLVFVKPAAQLPVLLLCSFCWIMPQFAQLERLCQRKQSFGLAQCHCCQAAQ